ncbi:MAG: ribonuclease E inhibitor RraB [Chitinophagales bacterium]
MKNRDGINLKPAIPSIKYFFLYLFLSQISISCSRQSPRFINEKQMDTTMENVKKLNSTMLRELSKYGTNSNSALSLNFYFVTNDSMKAQHLADELLKMNYHTNAIHSSPKDHSLWVLTGNSARVNIDSGSLNEWTSSLCETGFRYDCQLEGWNPVSE